MLTIQGRCPTFPWSEADGARGYELALYRVEEAADAEAVGQGQPELFDRVRLPGGAESDGEGTYFATLSTSRSNLKKAVWGGTNPDGTVDLVVPAELVPDDTLALRYVDAFGEAGRLRPAVAEEDAAPQPLAGGRIEGNHSSRTRVRPGSPGQATTLPEAGQRTSIRTIATALPVPR